MQTFSDANWTGRVSRVSTRPGGFEKDDVIPVKAWAWSAVFIAVLFVVVPVVAVIAGFV